ncbi:MAG: AEC family transporter [Gammaproteobacteria bacterium]|nr:AEC family transporter [Gammaproteobacteria bacterium]
MQVLDLALPLFALILIGYVSARLKKLPESALGWMNFFIVYVVLPALFFQLIRKAPVESLANFRFIAAASGATVLVFFGSFVLGRFVLRREFPVATMQAVAGSYSNVGYMGPALTLAALGQSALVPTILIFCVDNAFLFIITPLFMAFASRNGEQSTLVFLLQIIRRVVLHPFILATILGVIAAATRLPVPTALDKILTMLSNSAAPAALFTMGVVIAHRKVLIKGPGVPLLLFIKLIIHPVLVYLLLEALGPFDPVWKYTAVLMACLPPALNVYVLASDYQTYVREASSIVLLGTILAVGSVTTALYLIGHGLI